MQIKKQTCANNVRLDDDLDALGFAYNHDHPSPPIWSERDARAWMNHSAFVDSGYATKMDQIA